MVHRLEITAFLADGYNSCEGSKCMPTNLEIFCLKKFELLYFIYNYLNSFFLNLLLLFFHQKWMHILSSAAIAPHLRDLQFEHGTSLNFPRFSRLVSTCTSISVLRLKSVNFDSVPNPEVIESEIATLPRLTSIGRNCLYY